MRATLYMSLAFTAVTIYLGLAAYVLRRRPNRAISWVFAGICMVIISYYLTNLFLYPIGGQILTSTPLPLRIKWGTNVFAATFYLHLSSFYFPPKWQIRKRWILIAAYVTTALFSLLAMFTNLLLAGPLNRLPGQYLGPETGELIYIFFVFFVAEIVVGSGGLIVGYRTHISSAIRRQIAYLGWPMALLIGSTIVKILIVLTRDIGHIPPELGEILLIVAGFFFANAVMQYGTFVGEPTPRGDLLISLPFTIVTLVLLFLGFKLDAYLSSYTPFPFPFATLIFLVISIVGIPRLQHWRQDRLIHPPVSLNNPQNHRSQLAQGLQEGNEQNYLRSELLGMLCQTIGTPGGYIAVQGERAKDGLIVQTIWGQISVQMGDRVSFSSSNSSEAQLSITLSFQELSSHGWLDIGMFCGMEAGDGKRALLALREKTAGRPFSPNDLQTCSNMAAQIEASLALVHLRAKQVMGEQFTAQQGKDLIRLRTEVHAAAFNLPVFKELNHMPLEIYALGALRVSVYGKDIPEAAWESERAKALLAYLLWKGRDGATRDEITLALWPNYVYGQGANVFHVTMNRLRRVLDPKARRPRDSDYILHERNKYFFNFSSSHWLDTSEFETLIKTDEIYHLKVAVTMYRGPYLDDVAWDLPPEVEVKRRALERDYEQALQRLIRQVHLDEAEIYLKKLLLVVPTEDRAHQQLIDYYLHLGRSDLVKKQLHIWQQSYHELDLDPSDQAQKYWNTLPLHNLY